MATSVCPLEKLYWKTVWVTETHCNFSIVSWIIPCETFNRILTNHSLRVNTGSSNHLLKLYLGTAALAPVSVSMKERLKCAIKNGASQVQRYAQWLWTQSNCSHSVGIRIINSNGHFCWQIFCFCPLRWKISEHLLDVSRWGSKYVSITAAAASAAWRGHPHTPILTLLARFLLPYAPFLSTF